MKENSHFLKRGKKEAASKAATVKF